MQGRLKQRYQIRKEVSRSSFYKGRIDVQALSDLGELLESAEGQVEVSFEFQHSDYDTPLVVGSILVELKMECQRCLQAMNVPVTLDFRLLVDASEDIVRETSLDTVNCEDGFIDIFKVVEDEIILALPLVALHESSQCNEFWQVADCETETAARENPFLVLKDLKTTH